MPDCRRARLLAVARRPRRIGSLQPRRRPRAGPGHAAERPARDDRHAAGRPRRLLRLRDRLDTAAIDALAGRGVRFQTAVAAGPLTGPSHATILTGLTPLGHGFREQQRLRPSRERAHGRRDVQAARATARRRSSRASRSTAASGSTAASRSTTTTCRGATIRGGRRTSSASRTRPPTRRSMAGRAAGRGARRPGSCGCTTTIRTRRTSRRRTCSPALPHQPYDGEVAFVDRELDRLLQRLDGARRRSRARSRW